jgi:CheY-like chemotaxis protein
VFVVQGNEYVYWITTSQTIAEAFRQFGAKSLATHKGMRHAEHSLCMTAYAVSSGVAEDNIFDILGEGLNGDVRMVNGEVVGLHELKFSTIAELQSSLDKYLVTPVGNKYFSHMSPQSSALSAPVTIVIEVNFEVLDRRSLEFRAGSVAVVILGRGTDSDLCDMINGLNNVDDSVRVVSEVVNAQSGNLKPLANIMHTRLLASGCNLFTAILEQGCSVEDYLEELNAATNGCSMFLYLEGHVDNGESYSEMQPREGTRTPGSDRGGTGRLERLLMEKLSASLEDQGNVMHETVAKNSEMEARVISKLTAVINGRMDALLDSITMQYNQLRVSIQAQFRHQEESISSKLAARRINSAGSSVQSTPAWSAMSQTSSLTQIQFASSEDSPSGRPRDMAHSPTSIPERYTRLVDAASRQTEKKKEYDCLVVDDVKASRKLASLSLGRLHYKVTMASDGEAAVEQFCKNISTITLILMDVNLPKLNGCEATALIREVEKQYRADNRTEHQRPCLILGLTAHGNKERLREYERHGMNGCITKGSIIHKSVKEAITRYGSGDAKFIDMTDEKMNSSPTHTTPNSPAESNVVVAPSLRPPSVPRPLRAPPLVEEAPEQPRCMVVEDMAVSQKVTARALTKQGYTVSVCDDAEQALTAFRTSLSEQKHFSLILMDVGLPPPMDGIDATREIRRLEQEAGVEGVVIFGLTGNMSTQNREQYKSCGMDGSIAKGASIVSQLKMALGMRENDPHSFVSLTSSMFQAAVSPMAQSRGANLPTRALKSFFSKKPEEVKMSPPPPIELLAEINAAKKVFKRRKPFTFGDCAPSEHGGTDVKDYALPGYNSPVRSKRRLTATNADSIDDPRRAVLQKSIMSRYTEQSDAPHPLHLDEYHAMDPRLATIRGNVDDSHYDSDNDL